MPGTVKKYIGDLFITLRFYIAVGTCIVLFITSFFIPPLLPVTKIILASFFALVLADYCFLFFTKRKPLAGRLIADRLSNGDPNNVILKIRNTASYKIDLKIIDELPLQLQERNFVIRKSIAAGENAETNYIITPTERGVYSFGNILLYIQTPLGLVIRRHSIPAEREVDVYPSFVGLRNHQLMSTATIEGNGNKRMRKIGQSMEFEQIKDYVNGDDIRTINWKATARKGSLMVNSYVDEKSQQVFCVIDKGRLMKMPFEGLSLLDYAINSTLALSNVCLQKQDKIGLISFAHKMGAVLPADRNPIQRDKIMEALYKEKTAFLESDFEMLYTQVRHKIKQRSLLVLYTNFESVNGLNRQVNYLRSIARHHLLLVVFFENTQLNQLSGADAHTIDDVYVKTIAEKYVFEKRMIVKELQKYGIPSILSTPKQLTVNTINKYLELKAQQAV